MAVKGAAPTAVAAAAVVGWAVAVLAVERDPPMVVETAVDEVAVEVDLAMVVATAAVMAAAA